MGTTLNDGWALSVQIITEWRSLPSRVSTDLAHHSTDVSSKLLVVRFAFFSWQMIIFSMSHSYWLRFCPAAIMKQGTSFIDVSTIANHNLNFSYGKEGGANKIGSITGISFISAEQQQQNLKVNNQGHNQNNTIIFLTLMKVTMETRHQQHFLVLYSSPVCLLGTNARSGQ